MLNKEPSGNGEVEAPAALADATLVDALLQRKEAIVASLLAEWRPTMMHMALRYVSTHAVAEEVIQETWLALLQGLTRFVGRSSLKTWALSILIERAQTRAKRDRRTITFSDLGAEEWEGDETDMPVAHGQADARHRFDCVLYGSPGWAYLPEEQILSGETITCIQQAIAGLPVSQREVMTLRDLEGWTAEEICTRLGLSEVNQRVLLSRARAKVRQVVQHDCQ